MENFLFKEKRKYSQVSNMAVKKVEYEKAKEKSTTKFFSKRLKISFLLNYQNN